VPALLVDVGTVAGVVAGLVLDPVGQVLADRSHAAEERRRAERAERRAAGTVAGASGAVGDAGPAAPSSGAPSSPVSVPELHDTSDETAPVPDGTTEAAAPVRHVLPAGRSVSRTVAAGVLTGVLWGVVASRLEVHGHPASLLLVLPFWVFCAMAVTVSVTDLTHRLVPRQVLYGALVLIVPLLVGVSAHLGAWRPLVDAAAAGLVAFGVFFVIWFFVPRGMGFGDVRLAGVIGVTVGYLGLVETYLAFLLGFVLGLVFGLVLMAVARTGRATRIPFAPALCIGAVVAIVWGTPLAHHLFHTTA
jgi:prepilin signal peptidase PulO-like enzyme (type II secretory pathway)